MTIDEASSVIRTLKPGQAFVYFLGDLATQREEMNQDGVEKTSRAIQISELANYMLRQGTPREFSFGEGSVVCGTGAGILTRRRLGDHSYEYIFTKRKGDV